MQAHCSWLIVIECGLSVDINKPILRKSIVFRYQAQTLFLLLLRIGIGQRILFGKSRANLTIFGMVSVRIFSPLGPCHSFNGNAMKFLSIYKQRHQQKISFEKYFIKQMVQCIKSPSTTSIVCIRILNFDGILLLEQKFDCTCLSTVRIF